MIRIKVYPGPFGKSGLLDEDGYLYISEDSKVGDLLGIMAIPKTVFILGFYSLNYKKVSLDKKLIEGDVLSFITPLSES